MLTIASPAHEYVIASDLHVGSGAADAEWGGLELFYADNAFTAFVDSLIQRTQSAGIRMTLIILGDLFDFPRVFPSTSAAADSDADAIARLECIRAGHPALFTDLGRLVVSGVDLVIVPGNHDRALARPSVFDHLLAMVAPGLAESFRCEPWHVVVPGVLYAEHGQQYHDINAFECLLDARTSELTRSAPTIGGAIDSLIHAAAKVANASGEAPPESLVQVVHHMVTSPRKAVRLVRPMVGLALAILRSGTNTLLATTARTRYREQLAVLADAERRLSPHSLVGIELISERRRRATWRRMATTTVRAAVSRTKRDGKALSLRRVQSLRQLEAARAVDAVLRKHGEEVPVYVMGHTHIAVNEPLGTGASSARLINTGTWIAGHSAAARSNGYPYAVVRHETGTGSVTATLRWWDPVRDQIKGP